MTSPTPMFALGPFDVLRPIARGGMGEVWLGRHRQHGTEAAIKVVRTGRDGDRLRRRLQAEVRALAGLDHPRIAAVLDTGAVDAAAERASAGRVEAGSPWLAMAWLPHGDLLRVPRPQSWGVTRALLLDVLAALAHAHARGIIHRDLKPGNVLLRVEGGAVRAVLTDFGIAQVLDGSDDWTADHRVVGTPEYMAPEQIRGRWRDLGPWTDLYALGCLGWALATGEPPFVADRPLRVTTKQLFEPAPPPALGRGYPPAFGDWLRRLLLKDPYARFERAADAAAALTACGDGVPGAAEALVAQLGSVSRPPGPLTREGPTPSALGEGGVGLDAGLDATQDGTLFDLRGWRESAFEAHPGALPPRLEPTPAPHPAAPPPDDWRRGGDGPGVVGRVGPGLFGLRTLPVVGRTDARDRLWSALREAWSQRAPRLCLIEAGADSGGRRIADWLDRRAHELGAASVVRATHGALPNRHDGLGAAVRASFRAVGADDEVFEARVDAGLARVAPEVDPGVRRATRDALVSLARRGVVERHGQYEELVAAVTRWLRWSARRRPVVLRLDDVHWSAPSMTMAARLMGCSDLPLLVVGTVPPADERSHVGAERRAALAALCALDRVERIAPGALGADDLTTLLTHGAGLDPSLARPLADAFEGCPVLAIQAVAEWLADGALRPGRQGLIADGGPPPLPADRLALGRARVARALATSGVDPEVGRAAIEAAAMLGEAVARADWLAVTGAPPAALSALSTTLLDLGLVRPLDDGFAFVHRFTRDAVLDDVAAGGRLSALALRCADAVRQTDEADPGPAERRGRYLLAGGHAEAALDALLVAARRACTAGGYHAAADLLDEAGAAAEAAGLPPDDVRRGRLWAIEAEAARFTGRSARAAEALAALRTLPRLDAHPWPWAEMLRLDAQAAFFRGEMTDARAGWSEARALFERAGDAEGVTRCLHGLGWAAASRGELDLAEACFAEAVTVGDGAGLAIQAAWGREGLSGMAAWRGRPDATAMASEAADHFARLGQVAGQALCAVHLSDALWPSGDLARIGQVLDRALALLRPGRSSLMGDVLTQRALWALDAGRPAEARADADEAERRWLDGYAAGHRCAPLFVLAEVELREGRVELAGDLFEQGMARADATLFMGANKGRILETLGASFAAVDPARARRALGLAHRVWGCLDPARAAAVAEALAALEPPAG